MLLSLIIPTLNEAARLGGLLARLRAMESDTVLLEIIVSDGSSGDETVALARAAGATVIDGARGRGAQLRAGAQAAGGDALWFLHADARPHPKSAAHIARCLRDPAICGGNFRLRFEGDGVAPRVFTRLARQQRRAGVYYGDSGIWARRDVYQALGGFQEWPLFEDYDFARRLEHYARRHALRTDYAPWPIVASARRIEKSPARTLAQWLLLQMLFTLGVSPQRLAQYYYRGS